ncbi:RluA family pseudouridine synthase [Alicyclobacillus herbarius]|uniref:RluA family pseudouridine synthase n=1 Tax=Alicyclobacillus herbarius TaxID=122960 RepID=UPI000419A8B6|nr:RluA family pseudouridine synthase [Alicyclobacillus herbarius]
MEVHIQGDTLVVQPDAKLAGQPLCALLTDTLHLPRGFVRTLFHNGRVYVGSRRAAPSDACGNAKIRLLGGIVESYGVEGWQSAPVADVLYADEHLFVVNKPSGVLVYPGTPMDVDTLGHRVAHWLALQGIERKIRHVHRLDVGTSGCLLYAGHAYSARVFDQQLRVHQIRRTYVACVHGRMPQKRGRIAENIGRDRHHAGRYRVARNGKTAITDYQVVDERNLDGRWYTLVICRLETGRTHQIRVHLSALGCPIVGDTLYGGGTSPDGRVWPRGFALHAIRLTFIHPYTRERLRAIAPFPESWHEMLPDYADVLQESLVGNLFTDVHA